VTAHTTAPAATGSPTKGRPRRQVTLAKPDLQPLLTDAHHDAIASLSTLLLRADPAPEAAAPASPTPAATTAILTALSAPDDKMPSRPAARRRAA
jgi:hypothetical protein